MPPLVPFTIAWLAGLALDARAPLSPVAWLGLGVAAGLAALLARRSLTRPLLVASLAVVALALGAARHAAARPAFDAATVAAFNDLAEPVTLTGVVVEYPQVSGSRTRLRVAVHTLLGADGREQAVRGLVLASLDRYPEWRYGDEVRLRGLLETPPVIEAFDYRGYLARQGIYSLLVRARGERLRSGLASPLFHALYSLRDRGRQVIALLLPEPHAALLTGILLGIDDGIPEDVMANFSATGATHILVISGFNFAVVAALLTLLAGRIAGRRWGAWLALVGIALYALLVGAEPAVVRAAVMGGLYVVARGLGRQTLALNSLAVAALFLTLVRPATLWDLGFQLSALATLGLILLVPPLTHRFERALAPLGARRAAVMGLMHEALVVTLAAQIMTVPLIVAAFGRLSPVSLLTNVLILPVQSWVMLSGGLATAAGLLWLPLGKLLALAPWLGLAWTVGIVEWTARFPGASVAVAGFQGPWLLGYYALLFAVLARGRGRLPAGRLRAAGATVSRQLAAPGALALAGLLALLPWAGWRYAPDRHLHLFMLDVGQGDALLIVTPGGQQILVDGGPAPESLLAALGRRLPPWDRRVELLVLTHPDADHLGGFPELLARYQVARVLHPGTENDTPLFDEWQRRLADEGAVVTVARRGQLLVVEPGLRLQVLHPGSRSLGEDINDDSVVLRLQYGAFCALLTGDIEAPAEEALVAGGLDECELLKIPHHGSATSTTGALLGTLRPRLALISVGAANRFGHPHPDVLARLAASGTLVLRTDQEGAVEIISDGRRLWLHTER